jgi:hypothetical protein
MYLGWDVAHWCTNLAYTLDLIHSIAKKERKSKLILHETQLLHSSEKKLMLVSFKYSYLFILSGKCMYEVSWVRVKFLIKYFTLSSK